jgi:NAD-dependent SIR2 family protein deacetylase
MGSYIYKPQVVLYGEGISKWSESVTLAQSADIHIIMGTSFLVRPFNMISYENRNRNLEVFIINNEPVEYNGPCTQIIGDTSEILKELLKKIRRT